MDGQAAALAGFRLGARDFRYAGSGLRRPECVVTLSDGSVLASDRAGIVTRIFPDGSQTDRGSGALLANTFALDDDGTAIVADLKRGAILSFAGGEASLLHGSYEGEPLGAVNFCLAAEAAAGEWYVSVATRHADFRAAIERPRADGRIFRLTPGRIELVADGLFFPNAMQIDPAAGLLYVAETTAGAISRAPLLADGTLGRFERFGPAPLYPGAYTDGLALDSAGTVWVTELSRNAILAIAPDGACHTVFEDPEGMVLRAPTDLAFGGPDLHTVFVGSLKMSTLPVFTAPVPGLAVRHWRNATRPAF